MCLSSSAMCNAVMPPFCTRGGGRRRGGESEDGGGGGAERRWRRGVDEDKDDEGAARESGRGDTPTAVVVTGMCLARALTHYEFGDINAGTGAQERVQNLGIALARCMHQRSPAELQPGVLIRACGRRGRGGGVRGVCAEVGVGVRSVTTRKAHESTERPPLSAHDDSPDSANRHSRRWRAPATCWRCRPSRRRLASHGLSISPRSRSRSFRSRRPSP